MMCIGCDGKKLVNYVRLTAGMKYTPETKTVVRECLKCKGTGIM